MTMIEVGLMNNASPSSGLTEEKFLNLMDYIISLKLHSVVLLDH